MRLSLTALSLLGPVLFLLGADPAPDKLWVYVGTYDGPKSKGIYRFELDLASGRLSAGGLAAEAANPSFLALHPNHRFLYAVAEGGPQGGGVTAFRLDPQSGRLTRLNHQSSGGAGPCHLVVDKAGKNVLAANYGGGSCCALPIGADGQLAPASAVIQHQGSSANPNRQKEPHAHSINLDAANRFAFCADLGLDKVLVYRFDPAAGSLTSNDPPFCATAPGAGPRHFAFHPNGRFAYVINELDCTVQAMTYDAAMGVLTKIQVVPTLPRGATAGGNNSTAEVQVHPNGRFLYGSNRGHNTIAVFAINEATGELTPAGHQGTGIKTPRNFGIDPTGQYLIAANQDGDSLVVFRIDAKTGELQPTGHTAEVGKPVCVKFLAPGK